VILVSLAGLSATLGTAVLASDPATVGPAMLLPWIALFAFEVGAALGLGAAVIAFTVYLLAGSDDGLVITTTFVVGRFASFVLIAVGVGIAGGRLRRSERRSRRLVEGLPLVMYTEDDDGLTYISPQIEPLLGYPIPEWLANVGLWRRSIHPDDRDRVIARYMEAVAARDDLEYEYRLLRSDGRAVWVRDSSAYVPDGSRSYRQGFIVDVTAQKESAAQAERNATLMRALIDGTVDGITLTDRDGRIVAANRPMIQFARELGIPQEGLMHERLLGIASSVVERERYVRRMHELAASPDLESADEFELREPERVFQGFTKPVVGKDGAYLGRVWTLREVTEARQVDRIKDALVATVSHELRTPLTSIIGYLELIGTGDEPLSEDDARFVEIVRRNAARLQRMVEELLFLSRVEAGGLPLDVEQVDVVQVARASIGSAGPAAAAKELVLEFYGPGTALTRADAHRIGQVFDNLISNAIKFTPAGGRVAISVRSDTEAIVATVSDTGCGIPHADQPQLFERFFRSSATKDLPGTGLGLTVVRAIIEGHGGEIACRSSEGEGTTFTFTLPRKSPAAETAPTVGAPTVAAG
jgi:PAS domain S-box-containing protein